MNGDHKLASSSPDQQQHHQQQQLQLRYLDGQQQHNHPLQMGHMQQLVQPPGPPMGYHDDFFAHFDRATIASHSSSIGRYQQQPQVMMQLQQSAQQQIPRRPSLTLGGPSLSGFGATSTFHTSASGSTSLLPPPQYQHHLHHQHPIRVGDHTNNFQTTIVASPMRAPPTNTAYARSSLSSIASLHQRQQQELNELREKERRLCELRQEQERLRRIKREQRGAVGRHRPDVGAGSSSCSSASVYTPSSISASRNTANTPSSTKTITESSTCAGSSNPHLPSPRPPSVDFAASANPIPDYKKTVNVPPAETVARRPLGWFVCTLCKSRAFSSESDLADHQAVCANHDVSAATAIPESLAAKEEAQARAKAELQDRLSSAKAQVAALQQQIQQTQQHMVPMPQTIAGGPTTVDGGTFSSSTSSQPMLCMTANNNKESSSINDSNTKTNLESLGIDDVTRLAMLEMTKKASVNETDDVHGSAVNTTAHGLAPSKRKERQGQLPSSMLALTSSTRRIESPAEFGRDEIVIGERLEDPIPLGIPLDKDMLTPLHCFIREHCVQVRR